MHCEYSEGIHSSVSFIQWFVDLFIILCALWFIQKHPLYSSSEVKGVLAPSQSIKDVKSTLNQSSPCALRGSELRPVCSSFNDHSVGVGQASTKIMGQLVLFHQK